MAARTAMIANGNVHSFWDLENVPSNRPLQTRSYLWVFPKSSTNWGPSTQTWFCGDHFHLNNHSSVLTALFNVCTMFMVAEECKYLFWFYAWFSMESLYEYLLPLTEALWETPKARIITVNHLDWTPVAGIKPVRLQKGLRKPLVPSSSCGTLNSSGCFQLL